MAINTDKPAEFSQSQIDAFQNDPKTKSRGKVELVKFPSDADPEKPACFWIAKPNRQQLAMIQEAGERSTNTANDLIVNTGVLAGDVDQLEFDDAMYFGLLSEVQSLVQAKKKI